MADSQIFPAWEQSHQETREEEKRQKDIRKKLIKGDGDSRPEYMWRTVRWLRRQHKESDDKKKEEAKQRAQSNVEGILTWIAWGAWLAVAAVVAIDLFGDEQSIVIYDSVPAGIAVAVVGAFFLVAIMQDVSSYRPRLFAQCMGPPAEFFRSLADLASDLRDYVEWIGNEQPASWRRVKEMEQGLLVKSSKFILPDGVRTGVIRRIFQRLAGLVGSLALLGYGLSVATQGDLLRACGRVKDCTDGQSADTLPEHVFFNVISFINGVSDLQLVQAIAGYAYLAVVAVSFVAVIYFFLTDVVASQGEFRANIRAAAESYVLQQSKL